MNETAILVLNYNNYQMTINCVEKLIKLGIDKNIFIVDNKSTNESFEIIKEKFRNYLEIYLITSDKNGGYAYGNNFGIRFIIKKFKHIKYVAIMNPDIEITEERDILVLKNVLEKNKDILCVSGINITNKTFNFNYSYWNLENIIQNSISNLSLLRNIKFRLKNTNQYVSNSNLIYVDVISGCFFMVKLDEFVKIDCFDENTFLYFEENIISKKAKSIGKKIAISLNVVYYHNHECKTSDLDSITKKRNDYRHYCKSQTYYCRTYCDDKINIILLYLTQFIHYNIEIPIIVSLKKFKDKIIKRMSK